MKSLYSFILLPFIIVSSACKPIAGNEDDMIWQTQIAFQGLNTAEAPVEEFSNGVLFTGTKATGTVLFFLDKQTGSIQWEWSDWILPRESILLRGFYLYQTTLLFQNGENTYAVNIQTGKTLWRIQHQSAARLVTGLGDKFFFTPKFTTVAQGKIESGTFNELFSISEMSGFRVVINTPIPFLAANRDTMLLTTRQGLQLSNSSPAPTYLMLYNLTKRQLLYDSAQQDNTPWGLPQIVDSKVYMAIGESIQCNDLQAGKLLWRRKFESNFVFSHLTVSEGKIFAGCEDTNFYCLDAETGAILWQLNGIVGGSRKPFVMNGVVYFNRTFFYAVDANNGQILWKKKSPDNADFFGIISGSNGKVYVQSDKSAYCYKAAR